ncbi:hypothetical protein [Caballeronia concitans]|nr:hypothetical protein [Caballeronia concitans]
MMLLTRLEGVRQVAPGRWRAMCPAHEGHRPALAITETADGTVLMHCFAGCGVTEIAAALELNLADLFPPDWRDGPGGTQRTLTPCVLIQLDLVDVTLERIDEIGSNGHGCFGRAVQRGVHAAIGVLGSSRLAMWAK